MSIFEILNGTNTSAETTTSTPGGTGMNNINMEELAKMVVKEMAALNDPVKKAKAEQEKKEKAAVDALNNMEKSEFDTFKSEYKLDKAAAVSAATKEVTDIIKKAKDEAKNVLGLSDTDKIKAYADLKLGFDTDSDDDKLTIINSRSKVILKKMTAEKLSEDSEIIAEITAMFEA